ncbi:hypothetical protein [Nitratifractor salsuginis]|uniref:DUF86 domain-containing protein n=1 Tax=Nitratifractor salsuginis (strain DSM 16511 / JCM 12458 / E9I37-1) TaxID=749222 RepID=E6X068_NITSE|nr:hypothetical protein [Nitratifractor salsuginis]ADV46791.1 hypothetical protein Nitsa_1543 [Nitratifractor salsuginis DSM 16511]
MIRTKLLRDRELLQKQMRWLELSLDECGAIGIKAEYSIEEFGKFETLCSRYARSIDFLVRKIFRTIDAYEFEAQGTLVDVVNRAHKRGLIESVDELRLMKDIRNTIVHEYIEDELTEVFDEVLEYGKKLLAVMQTTDRYIEKIAAE